MFIFILAFGIASVTSSFANWVDSISKFRKHDVDPTAKFPAFVHQVVAVESPLLDVDAVAEPLIEEIDLDLDED